MRYVLRNYSLPKLARFLRHSVDIVTLQPENILDEKTAGPRTSYKVYLYCFSSYHSFSCAAGFCRKS